jgi:hypothetical protein
MGRRLGSRPTPPLIFGRQFENPIVPNDTDPLPTNPAHQNVLHSYDSDGETKPSGTGVMNVGSIPSSPPEGGFGKITPSKGSV